VATLHGWPNGDDGDDAREGESARLTESGPLDALDQVTGELEQRLTQRWSQPPRRDTTDEVEALSPLDADLVRRFLEPAEPPFWRPTHPTLPPLASMPITPDLPPAPQAQRHVTRPGSVRPQPTVAVATPPAGVRTGPRAVSLTALAMPAAAPINVTRLVAHSFHIAIRDSFLPHPALALMDIPHRRIWLAPALAPVEPSSAGWEDYALRLEHAIEARPFTRYLLATLWTRWYCEPPREVPPARTLVATFAPAEGFARHLWQRWHGSYYTWLWHQTNTLVAAHDALDTFTATYLGLGPVLRHEVPRLGRARAQAVEQQALRVLPALRASCRTAEEFARAAWAHYSDYLARAAAVPRAIITDRLAQDALMIQNADDLCAWTDILLAESPELGTWRDQVARSSGLYSETSRWGIYRSAAQRVALWLAEPSALLRYPPFP